MPGQSSFIGDKSLGFYMDKYCMYTLEIYLWCYIYKRWVSCARLFCVAHE